MMHFERPYCLSIAGFDPCAGAGVLADTKTFEQLEVYGLGVVTSLTYQNDNKFIGATWVSFDEIKKQLIPLTKYSVKVAKIGLIENIEKLEKLVAFLKESFPRIFVIWDPILKASAGFEFHKGIRLSVKLKEGLDLITPNLDEFNQMNLSNEADLCPVLLKGGHKTEKKGTDTLLFNSFKLEIEGKEFKKEAGKHGTGCVLSSAIAAYIAKGFSLPEACEQGKKYVEKFILSNNTNLGYHK